MPSGDVYKVRTRGTLRNQQVEFGVHLVQTGATGSVQDIAASWVAEIMPLVLAATSAAVNWNEVVVSDTKTVAEGGTESFTLALTQPNPGLVAGDALPGQDTIVVSLRTGLKGARRRGRFYLPGVSEASQAEGLLGAPQLAAVQALGQALIDTYGPGGSTPQYGLRIWSPEKLTFPEPKPQKPRVGVQITPVTGYIVDQTIRSQRRRQAGVGR